MVLQPSSVRYLRQRSLDAVAGDDAAVAAVSAPSLKKLT